MIEVRDVHKAFGKALVLRGLSLSVEKGGTDLNRLRRRIGIVFQQFSEARELAAGQLEQVGLGDKLDARPSQLSGGQQQRLAIARALAMSPDYMLFDEITSALGPELVGEVLDALRMLRRDGMTMICVTHEMRFARDAADRIVFIDGGRVCEEGPPAEIFADPKEARTRHSLRQVA